VLIHAYPISVGDKNKTLGMNLYALLVSVPQQNNEKWFFIEGWAAH